MGLIKDLQVHLATNSYVFVSMDIMVVDVPLVWVCFYVANGW